MFFLPNFSVEASETQEPVISEEVQDFLGDDEQALNEFGNLPIDKQEEFAEIIKNPELIEENLELKVKDPIIFSEPEIESGFGDNYGLLSVVYRTTHTTRYTMTLLGINMASWAHELVYRRTEGRAIEILSQGAIVERIINPLVQSSLTSSDSYISGGDAIANATFSYEIGPFEGLTAQIGTLGNVLVGDGNGEIAQSTWTRW